MGPGLGLDDARLLARRAEHLPGQKPLEPAPPHLVRVSVRVRNRVRVRVRVRGGGRVRGRSCSRPLRRTAPTRSGEVARSTWLGVGVGLG